jgi:hypothetical protein
VALPHLPLPLRLLLLPPLLVLLQREHAARVQPLLKVEGQLQRALACHTPELTLKELSHTIKDRVSPWASSLQAGTHAAPVSLTVRARAPTTPATHLATSGSSTSTSSAAAWLLLLLLTLALLLLLQLPRRSPAAPCLRRALLLLTISPGLRLTLDQPHWRHAPPARLGHLLHKIVTRQPAQAPHAD